MKLPSLSSSKFILKFPVIVPPTWTTNQSQSLPLDFLENTTEWPTTQRLCTWHPLTKAFCSVVGLTEPPTVKHSFGELIKSHYPSSQWKWKMGPSNSFRYHFPLPWGKELHDSWTLASWWYVQVWCCRCHRHWCQTWQHQDANVCNQAISIQKQDSIDEKGDHGW